MAGRRVGDLNMPEGTLLISVLREGREGSCRAPDTVLEAGDEVLAVLDPGVEEDLKAFFGSDSGAGSSRLSVEYLLIGGRDGLRRTAPRSCASGGRRGSILLVGREPEPPYERPPLSKEYLRGEAKREDAYVNPGGWYERERGGAAHADERDVARPRGDGRRSCRVGRRWSSSKALIATGANVNILRVEGAELEGIHYLRAFGNSDAIREAAERADRGWC